MLLVPFLSLAEPSLRPAEAKIHLATGDGREQPIDVYLSGKFDDWQRRQTRRNFERKLVLSLIFYRAPSTWLFAGLHRSAKPTQRQDGTFWYQLEELPSCRELNGRVVVRFERPGRQSYLNRENWSDRLFLEELRPTRLSIAAFPGFKAVHLTKDQLDLILREHLPEWASALSSVAGVYLISDDSTGKMYVGSATGEGGLWSRWTSYAVSGHGGNARMREVLDAMGVEHSRNLRFSVLEIADTHASANEVLMREQHWKLVLQTRRHGLNAN